MKGIESVMRGYAEGSVNPFQDYAGGPQSYNPFAALSYLSAQGRPQYAIRPPAIATPSASTTGGYRDIYGNFEATKAAQAAKRAAEAAARIPPSVPEIPSAPPEGGDKGDPATAGGTATTESFRDFALSALSALNPTLAVTSILGQMVANPARQPTTPSLFGLYDAIAERGYDQRAGEFTGPGGQSRSASPTLGGISDIDIDAFNAGLAQPGAVPTDVEAMAPTTGVDYGVNFGPEVPSAPASSGDSSSTPGQGGGATPGDPTGGAGPEGLAQGGYVPGKSGGMDDDVPAIIDGKQPARLSSGEFVFDAATVAALGDGNNQAGAKKLDGLRKAIRKKAYGHEKQPPKNYSVGDLVRMHDRRR